MKVQDKNESSKFLSFICQDSLTFSTRFASFSFSNSSTLKLTEKIILLLQYIQLLSQIFLLNTTIIKDHENKFEFAGVRVLVQFASFFQPGYWISFRDQKQLVKAISSIFLVLIVLRYVLFAFLCKISSSKSSQGNNTIIKIWRFIFLLQGRVLCGFFVSFWVNMIVAIQRNEMEYLEISDSVAILICAILSILEYLFSFFLQIKFCYMLPTKSFLASKNNDLEIWTLLQKFVLQLLQVILANTSSSIRIWIVVFINLILSLATKTIFLINLPLYNLQALKYLGSLQTVALTLNISCFFQAVSSNYFESQEDGIKFVIIIWTILACFGVRISDLLLNKLFLKLITTKSFSLSPQLLIHKIIIINKVRKSWTQPMSSTSPNSWYFLLTQSIMSNLKHVLSQDDIQDIMESKDTFSKNFINYIDKLLLKNPKNNFIKLYASYFYAKKIGYFANATRLVKELSSHQTSLTASLFQAEIQNIIRAELRKNSGILDILTYLQGKEQVIQFKTTMLSQASIQADIYKEILSDSPDLAKIFDNSQKVNRLSTLIEKKLKRYLNENKDAPIELYMLLCEYSQKLNYSMSSLFNQEKLYFKRIEKFQQLWNNDEDSEIENLCQERCPVVIISGQKGESGKIVYCSKPTEKVFGAEQGLITGSHVASWAPSCIENFVFQTWKKSDEKADVFHFANFLHLLLHHRDGYLVKAHGNVGIHPFIGQGIYYTVIIRASINYKTEFILIQKNGEIDCASERIAKRLNLLVKKGTPLQQKPHIRDICSELEKVNQAFNLVNGIDENNGMNIQEATELYSLYTNSGKDLLLKNLNYCCKLEMMPYGDEYLKIMSLEVKHQDQPKDQMLQLSKKKQNFADDADEETDYVESEFEEGKQSALLETSLAKPPKTSRFFKETIPLTESNLFTYENPTPLETGTLSSKRLLVQQHTTSPFKQVGKNHHVEGSVHESIRSKGSKEKRIETAYRTALHVKSCPKYLRIFNIAFYSIIIAIITAHIIYHYSLEKTMENLIGKKQVLGKAQLSNYYLIQTTGFYRIVQDTIVQRFTPSEFGLYGISTLLYLPFLSWVIKNLNNANQDLLASTDTLTQENRDYIFTSDVKIYNNYFDSSDQDFQSLTNFEGTNRIVETGLAAIDQTKQGLTSGLDNFKLVYRNTLNDLLMKNSVIASFFYASFMDEFKEIPILTNKFMIGTPLLLITITISLISIILKQYNQERINLTSITKLNALRLKEMQASIQEFIVVVETEELVSDEFLDKVLDEDQQQYQRRILTETKRGSDKTFNDTKIMKKYLILLLKVLLLFMSLLLVIILHLLVSKRSVDFFKDKSIQIDIYDYIRNRIYLSGVASQELFSAPANAEIENIPIATWTAQSPQLIQTLRLLVSDTLLAQNGSLDPEIQSLILKDGCPASVVATNAASCKLFAQKGMKSGLMYLLSYLEDIFETRQSSYQQSGKSEQALRDIEARDFNLVASITLTLASQCNLITKILNQQVEKNLSLSDEQRRTTTALGMSLLVVLVIMIWFFVLRRFQNTVNNFKKVLKVLPADLALSSFILKNFLKSTSEGALDAVKSYI